MTPVVYQEIATAMRKAIQVSGGPEALRRKYATKPTNVLAYDVFWLADTYHDLHHACRDDAFETTLFLACKRLGLIK